MELRHLATFVAVAEEGSFTRASAQLHVVQSAVSAGVRALERELGSSLFDRTTHRVTLTDAGRALLPEAHATLAAARAARDAVDRVRGGLRGVVRVGTMQADALSGVSLARLLAAFRAEHPDVELHVRQGFSADMAEQVREGRLDFAFLALPSPRAAGLTLTPIRREVMALGVHTGHRLAGRADVELSALVDETFADGPPKWGTRVAADRAFAAAGIERRVALEINDTRTMIDFVRHGVAAAFLAPSFVREPDGIALVPVRHHAPVFETFIAEPAWRRRTWRRAPSNPLPDDRRPNGQARGMPHLRFPVAALALTLLVPASATAQTTPPGASVAGAGGGVGEREPADVDKGFRLRLFEDLEQTASDRVAVGKPGHITPTGRYTIANKAVDPAWSAPDRPWAGALVMIKQVVGGSERIARRISSRADPDGRSASGPWTAGRSRRRDRARPASATRSGVAGL